MYHNLVLLVEAAEYDCCCFSSSHSSIGLNQHLVECSDVVLGNLDGLKLAQLTVVSVLGQEVSQVVKGHVELTHALPLSVVGVQTLLLPLSERQNLRTGPPLLSRGFDHHHSVQVRIFCLQKIDITITI